MMNPIRDRPSVLHRQSTRLMQDTSQASNAQLAIRNEVELLPLVPAGVTGHEVRLRPDTSAIKPRQISASAVAAWKKHVAGLTPLERQMFKEYEKGSLAQYTAHIENLCKKQGEASKGMKIANFVRPWYRVMNQYAPVAETIMQADPTSSTILLGGITCILSISDRYGNFPEKIMDTLSVMGDKIDLLTKYGEDVYQDNDSVQGAIVEVFADVLRFNKRALQLLLHEDGRPKSTARMFFKSVISSFQGHFGDIVGKFEKDLAKFEEQAKLCSTIETHQYQSNHTEALVYIASEIMQTRADIHQNHVSAMSSYAQHSATHGQPVAMIGAPRRKQEDELENRLLREEIVKWLQQAAIDFYTDQNNLILARTDETGIWFVEDTKYVTWKQDPSSELLWVKAERGCGKTHLASAVVQDLKAMCDSAGNLKSNAKEMSAFAFVYCTSLDAAKLDLTRLLSSLVLQLSNQLPGTVVDPLLKDIYKRNHATRVIGFEEISRVLESLVCMFDRTYLVVDGLDELRDSPNEQLEKQCKFLRHLVQSQRDKSTVKVISFSRPEYPAISSAFTGCPQLRIDDGANDQDIEKFIAKKWEAIESHFPKDPDIAQDLLHLKQELVRKSEGMFLWVEHTLRALRGQYTIKGLRQKIEESPKGLDSVYQQALVKIVGNEQAPNAALKILLWVCNAKRPLFRAELMDALAIHPGMTTLGRDDRIYRDDDFCSKCEDLIVLDHTHQTYQPRHSSLKDYLAKTVKDPMSAPTGYRQLQEAADYILGETCLTYLNFTDFGSGPLSSMESLRMLIDANPFLSYAAVYWGTHVAASQDDHLRGLTQTFVTTSERRDLMMQMFIYLDGEDPSYSVGTSVPAHLLAIFDLVEIASSLPDLAMQVAAQDDMCCTPVDYALQHRSRRICNHLLMVIDTLEDVDDNSKYSLLHMAARNGWADTIKRLMDLGCDVTKQLGDIKVTPLHAAAEAGSLEALTTLLENSADKDARENDGSTPLWIACNAGHSDVAKKLIAAGADVSLCGPDGSAPLHYAAIDGDFELTQMLLQKRAEKNPVFRGNGYGRTPLHFASEHGRLNVLQALLKSGAKMDFTDSNGASPLSLACERGNMECVDVLLAAGANLDVQDSNNANVVHLATSGGHLDVLKLLFRRKNAQCRALVNNMDSDGDTALRLAAASGHSEITKFLLGKGAVAKTESPHGRYPIHAAIAFGHVDIIQTYMQLDESCARWQDKTGDPAIHWIAYFSIEYPALNDLIGAVLDAKSDPEAENENGWRAIHIALLRGNVRFMEILLDKLPGLQLNALTARKQSALHVAADEGRIESVKWLMATQGALKQTQDSDGNTPLHCAAWEGFLDVVKLTLTPEIIDLGGFHGRTALFGACSRGHSDCVRWLLDNDADLNKADDYGGTPLIASIDTDHIQIANILLDRGAMPFIETKQKRSALHSACLRGDEALVRRLLDLKPDPFHRDLHDIPIFHLALFSPNPKVIDAFIEHQLDRWDLIDFYGRTSLHQLAAYGDVKRLKRFKHLNLQHLGAVDIIGINPLLYAAAGGHVEMCEELLELGVQLQGAGTTPRGALHDAAGEGYVQLVRKLIQTPRGTASLNEMNGAELGSPLHNAVSAEYPGTASVLLQSGASLLTRDSRGLLALDYTSHAPQLWSKHGILKPDFIYTKLTSRVPCLKETALQTALKLIGQPDNLTRIDEYYRLRWIVLLGTTLHEISTKESRDKATICFLECMSPVGDAFYTYNWDCRICSKHTSGPLYICEQSLLELYLCNRCYKEYETGDGLRRQAPESLRLLESLQRRIRPIRQALAPFVKLGSEFILESCVLLTSNNTSLTELEEEGRKWTESYNKRRRFGDEQVVDLQFLEWMRKAKRRQEHVSSKTQQTTASEEIAEESDDDDSHSIPGILREDQPADDDENYNALNQELITLFREGRPDKELRTFNCDGHQFWRITTTEDATQEQKSCFDKDGRITKSWLRDLADWLSQLVVETDATEIARDEQASSATHADKVTAEQAEENLGSTASNICGDSESATSAANSEPEPADSVNSADLLTPDIRGREKELDNAQPNQDSTADTDSVYVSNDAELERLRTVLLQNIVASTSTKEEAESRKPNMTGTSTEESSTAAAGQIHVLNVVEATVSSLDSESSLADYIKKMEDNNMQSDTDRPSNDGVSQAKRDVVHWVIHEAAWRVAQARLLGAATLPTLRQQWVESLAAARDDTEHTRSEETSSAVPGAEIHDSPQLDGPSDKDGATRVSETQKQARDVSDHLDTEEQSRAVGEAGHVERDALIPELVQQNPASSSPTDGPEAELRMDIEKGTLTELKDST